MLSGKGQLYIFSLNILSSLELRSLLRKCSSCNAYTLREDKCPKCGGALRIAAPPRFSPDDPLLKMKLRARRYLVKMANDP
ncbi:MAG: nucleolar RNA-binding Nop10p family protein [Thermoproteota archaeon]